MKNTMVMDAQISALSQTSWEVTAKDLLIIYSFNEEKGIVLEQLRNSSGERDVQYCKSPESIVPINWEGKWSLNYTDICESVYGGRPVVKLDVSLSTLNAKLCFHVVVFPGNSIIRQWFEVENTSFSRSVSFSIKPFSSTFLMDDYKDTYCCRWFTGGNSQYDQGLMHTEPIGKSGNLHLCSEETCQCVPLILLTRENSPYDGFMVEMDYCGVWTFDMTYASESVKLEFAIDNNKNVFLKPAEKLELPIITLGGFSGNLDNLMKELYDWQYSYQWDYTNNDYYAKTRNIGNWVYNARNLHEQFTYRLASFNLRGAQEAQSMGYDIFWDDAGWSSYPGWPPDSYGSVFQNNYDGPDFSQSQRFFKKCGINWLVWFAGKPSLGLLESKEAAWGSFEWRTDALYVRDMKEESEIKNMIKTYLEGNPHRSFHTCSGGSTYSHTFDIQRYANYNYLSDLGAGPYLNYYFSFFETPDRWGDILLYLGDKYLRNDGASTTTGYNEGHSNRIPKYSYEHAHSRMGMVPMTGPSGDGVDFKHKEAVRRDVEIYRYLIKMGVAGRWSYMFHPVVYGDKEHYYMQRTNKNFKRAFIFLHHRPENEVTVFPKSLIDDYKYHITFQNDHSEAIRTGSDLMVNGIKLKNITNGELIYLNLSDHPGNGKDITPPQKPGSVVYRVENNIGNTGIGIYWSPGSDDSWISYYEVSRDNEVISRVGTGHYYFDYSNGWNVDSLYSVRTVVGDGNCSDWQESVKIIGEKMQISALGGHNSEQGYNGWFAEVSYDRVNFIPMSWIPPNANPAADLGGTPNQIGGTEGYWEGPAGARIGRGWQQASPDVCCSRTHTILKSCKIHITGRAMKEWYHQDKGQDVKVCIMLNDKQIWPVDDWAVVKCNDLFGVEHNIGLIVSKGDKIRFVIDKVVGAQPDIKPWFEDVNLIGWIPRMVYEQNDSEDGLDSECAVRINCGCKAAATDAQGRDWDADEFFSGYNVEFTTLVNSEDAELFSSARVGKDIIYNIPVALGVYCLRLCFIESQYAFNDERLMSVAINGDMVARELDIVAECKGAGRKLEKIYNYIVPNKDGMISVRLTGIKNDAMIQTIEIASELRDHLLINCGSDKRFIDWAGYCWEPDYGYANGECLAAQAEPTQVTPTLYDKELYLSARSGMEFEYRLAVKQGIYSVHLKFAELWSIEPGNRPFNIYINGMGLKYNWDPATAAQRKYMACDLRFEGIGSVNGYITITLKSIGMNPSILQALEIC